MSIIQQLRTLISREKSAFLPSYRSLSVSLGFSVPTIAKALKELEQEGLLDIRPRGKIRILANESPEDKNKRRQTSAEQIYQKILLSIKNGEFRVGYTLPKTRYLCHQWRVSSKVLSDAIKRLHKESLVYKVGKEWIVGNKPSIQKSISE